MADKFEPPSGHTKSGWCPVRQRFAEGVAHRRLRDLNVAPRELSADACAFLERVRSGNYVEVSKELGTKPELILMCVPAAPAYLVAADPQTPPKWTWSGWNTIWGSPRDILGSPEMIDPSVGPDK